jgi:hypothetical protein
MSDRNQPGQHPDTDQLNAFLEHALPLHEQEQTLAHLAICADCREIVYLSQQSDQGEVQTTQTISLRKPWFSGWKVALPAAAALACLVIVTIHLRSSHVSNKNNAAATSVEIPGPPAPIPTASSVPRPDQPQSAPPKGPKKRFGVTTSPVATPGALTAGNAGHADGSLQLQSMKTLPLSERPAPFLPQASTASASASIHGSIQGSTNESRDSIAKAAPVPGMIGRSPGSSAAFQRKVATPEAMNELQQNATIAIAPPLSAPSTTVAGVSQTVDVAPTTSLAAFGQQQTAQRLPPLPSHLSAVSVVSDMSQTLAIDISGKLFLSNDGTSWQPIEPQWTGRAVKLRLAPLLSPSQKAADKDAARTNMSHGRTGSMGGSIASAHPAVFELVTDTGVIWTSADGQNWKQK